MPEEVNRVVTDHISEFLFCPTDTAVSNLKTEGINKGVFKVGDVMYDAFLAFKHFAQKKSRLISELKLNPGSFYLATVHRQENTDNPDKLVGIFKALEKLACDDCPVILPIHPRTKKAMHREKMKFVFNHNVKLIPPVSYLEIVALEAGSKVILTDSGGMQKEAYFACVPCITLRDETEWVETVDAGWNLLAGANTEAIIDAVNEAAHNIPSIQPQFYGNGNASQKITHLLAQEF
jgi:UDP-N-acetylglucosamine 2-epimerase